MNRDLILIGASVRAAAFSALRAGMRPWCADLFADADLSAICDCQRVSWETYPHAFAEVFSNSPQCPWVYTGGLENHPELIDSLSGIRPLLGNSGEKLQKVRSPEILKQVLSGHGIPFPDILCNGQVPDHGLWLSKPFRSAGGLGIDFAKSGTPIDSPSRYVQAYLTGPAFAAIYFGKDGQSQLLGVTRQLVGTDWLNAGPFTYCGSIGSIAVAGQIGDQCCNIGQVLTESFHLEGIFGVDCVLHNDQLFVLEVNPRYTASVEVLELAHHAAFLNGDLPGQATTMLGKAILYADRDFAFPNRGSWLPGSPDPWHIPAFADVPHPGTKIETGQPVFTYFVSGTSEEDILTQLRCKAEEFPKQFLAGSV